MGLCCKNRLQLIELGGYYKAIIILTVIQVPIILMNSTNPKCQLKYIMRILADFYSA